ncbi:MAG: OprD family outer membrane porin, partial [Negativicutes bacterium]|nr:OprD family outer membrane porin [Negativicutes bacterium]
MFHKNRVGLSVVTMGCLGLYIPTHAQAAFLEDTNGGVGFRNFYDDRDFKQDHAPISRAGSWSQGFDFRLNSGYTEGTVKFGVDASAQYAYRLDGGGGRGPDTILPYDATHKEQVRDYGRAGVTGKMKFSKTEVKVGELRPMLPVVSMDDSRQLVTTYQGAMVESKEVEGLTLTGGRITEISGRAQSDRQKLYLSNGPDIQHRSDGLNFGGATYSLSPTLSATYFYGQLEDIYQQHYLGLTKTNDLGNGFGLKTDVRYYHNSEDGKAMYGEIDNRSYGAMTTLKEGGHSIGVGYQRMVGDSAFPLLNGYAPAPYLINWSTLGFFKANETSWQVRYDYDFAALGVPGLKLMTR